MTFAGMCGTLAVGPILANYGNQAPYLLALLPAAAIFWPLSRNYLGEKREHPQARQSRPARNPAREQPSVRLRLGRCCAGDARSAHAHVAAADARLPGAHSAALSRAPGRSGSALLLAVAWLPQGVPRHADACARRAMPGAVRGGR
jgi:hypothetical protein